MGVVWTWHGAVTEESVWVRARVEGDSAELLVADNAGMSGAAVAGTVAPDGVDMASVLVEGLQPSSRYYYRWVVDSEPEPDFDGTFLTAPPVGQRSSFTVGAAGDAGLAGAQPGAEYITDAVSNNPVFDTMRAQAIAEDWVQFVHLGDLHYRDIETNDHQLYRDAYDDNLTFNGALGHEARQGRFLRSVASAYLWDDHDYGPNNSDRTHAGREAAAEVYRETVPHYPLPAQGVSATNAPIFQSWQIGRVLFIGSDVRWARDPNSGLDNDAGAAKANLGGEQLAWMEHLLHTNPGGAEALVWALPDIWMSDVGETRDAGVAFSGSDWSNDSFRRFRRERDRIVDLLGDTGWLDRMVQLTADKHALSISSGPGNPWGKFPVFMFASMDSSFSTHPEGQYDQGQTPGRQRYGTLRVQDNGHTIAMTGTGWINGHRWRSYTGYAQVEPHVLALNYAAGEVFEPFEPATDDQRTVNDFTATRRDGGERRVEETTGAMAAAEPPQGVGRYEDSATVNTFSDEALRDHAGWQVRKGTIEEERYPTIAQNLANERMAPHRATIAGLDVGDAVTIGDPPQWLPPGRITAVVEGYEEQIRTHEWEVDYHATPGEAAVVAEAAAEVVLNANAGLEANTGGWEPVGGDLVHDDSWSRRGRASARLEPDGSSASVRMRSAPAARVRVREGTTYRLSVWAYSAQGYDVDVSIRWFDWDGGEVGFFIYFDGSVPAEEWTLLEGTAAAPSGAVAAEININQRDTPAEADVLWLDEVAMRLDEDTHPCCPRRADTDGSELVEAVGEADTELVVATAMGEFGGARWINSEGPEATHVHDFPLDVALGAEEVRVTACEPYVWDLMRRTESGTWGEATSGHAWQEDGGQASERSTEPGKGVVVLSGDTTDFRAQTLTGAAGDFEIRAAVSVDQTAAGATLAPSVLLRYSGLSELSMLRVHHTGAGNVFLSVWTTLEGQVGGNAFSGYTYTPGDVVQVRVRVAGDRVLARAWKQAPADPPGLGMSYLEPAHWQIDRTSGAGLVGQARVGALMHAFGGNTNTDPELSLHGLEVVSPQRMTVQRAVNGVAQEHGAGTQVGLARPGIIGL